MPDAVYISLPHFVLTLLIEFDLNPQIILVPSFQPIMICPEHFT